MKYYRKHGIRDSEEITLDEYWMTATKHMDGVQDDQRRRFIRMAMKGSVFPEYTGTSFTGAIGYGEEE